MVFALRDLAQKTKKVFQLSDGKKIEEKYLLAFNGNETDREKILKRFNLLVKQCACYLPEEEGAEVVCNYLILNESILGTPGRRFSREKTKLAFKSVRAQTLERIVAKELLGLRSCVRVF
jgi:hypothetical protein